jgi:hypothetical protein
MADYPYSTVLQKIKPLLLKIKTIGVPSKVDYKWLQTIGYKSTNDTSLIPVLKNIQLIDSSGKPTDSWMKYRADNKILASCIRVGYSDLFATYPNAEAESKDNLSNFFSSKTTAGSQVIGKMVGTFLELCGAADFTGSPVSHTSPTPTHSAAPIHTSPILPHAVKNLENGVAININIQLTVPETTDEKVYEAFFSSMKKHLLS